jgi:hypothetical protein
MAEMLFRTTQTLGVARFKALKAAHRLESTPQPRSTRSVATTAEPVTTRIRTRRTQEMTRQPETEPVLPAAPSPLPMPIPSSASASLTLFELPLPC